jgi:N-acetylglucosaminyldiphosphoundecaprenol N-acetyl-beta-D-mannosaminyltransferase
MKQCFISIAGVRIDLISKQEILTEIDNVIIENHKSIFAYANAHTVNFASRHGWLKQFMQQAHVVYADGQGIRFGSWLTREKIPPHLPLTEWIWDILCHCSLKHYSIFLLGAKPDVIAVAASNITKQFPHLKIGGTQHGYFNHYGKDSEDIIQKINTLSPDVLFVGLGMPLQEQWIMDNFEKLKTHVIFPVGGCIDVLAGKRLKVPAWIRKIGLEWIVRLIEEPRRLFNRYIFGNPIFIYRVLLEKLKRKIS